MSRIDCFDVDVRWNDQFTRAELACGRAMALKSVEVANVRGGPRDWLRMRLEVDDEAVWRARVENVPLGGCASPDVSVPLPCDLAPGAHQCRLKCFYRDASAELSHPIEVLPDDYICLKMNRAELLAASVAVSGDALCDFADKATRGVDPRDRLAALCALYDGLRARRLPYQPVAQLFRGDYQRIRGAASTLDYGGSCADLSLLFAGLCYLKGLSPVLLMLQDHMMAGAWLIDPPEAAPCVTNPELVLELVDSGAVALLDVVALCSDRPVEQAIADARARLGRGVAMALTDVCAALRSGVVSVAQPQSAAPESAPSALICSHCGYDQFDPSALCGPVVQCPACERRISVPVHLRPSPDGAASDDDAPPRRSWPRKAPTRRSACPPARFAWSA